MGKRSIQKLTAREVQTAGKGRYGDGGGLYLVVDGAGSRKWVFRFTWAAAQKDMGLGSARDVPLAKAREKAAQARAMLAEGRNPLELKQSRQAIPTFGQVADDLIASMRPSWKNAKHAAQWETTLATYAAPIRPLPVDKISTEDVLKILRPIWQSKPETANRLRGRIERVFDAARAKGHRSLENPARWRGHLDAVLPRRTKLSRGHHKAMPYEAVRTFLTSLRALPSTSNLALEFTILTAARSGETRLMTWGEVDFEQRAWTIPAHRMKEAREHRVPLTDRAIAILRAIAPPASAAGKNVHVFPGGKAESPLSETALTMALRRLDFDGNTVHGFRSTFRDWAWECTSFPRELAEAALSHAVGDATERAYRRGDALEKRRELMRAWEEFCDGTRGSVVRLAV